MFFRFRYFLWGILVTVTLASCQNTTSPPEIRSIKHLPYLLVTPNLAGTTTPTPFQPNYSVLPTMTAASPLPTATLDENVTATVTLTPWATNTPAQSQTNTQGVYITATPNF